MTIRHSLNNEITLRLLHRSCPDLAIRKPDGAYGAACATAKELEETTTERTGMGWPPQASPLPRLTQREKKKQSPLPAAPDPSANSPKTLPRSLSTLHVTSQAHIKYLYLVENSVWEGRVRLPSRQKRPHPLVKDERVAPHRHSRQRFSHADDTCPRYGESLQHHSRGRARRGVVVGAGRIGVAGSGRASRLSDGVLGLAGIAAGVGFSSGVRFGLVC